MAGKRDSRRHSTTSFSENVVVPETSYQVLEVLSFCCDREGVEPPLMKITVLTFLEKKRKIKLSGLSFLRIREKTLRQISFLKSSPSSNLTVSLGTTTTTRYRAHGARKLIVPLEKIKTVHNIWYKSSNFVLLIKSRLILISKSRWTVPYVVL